MAAAARTWPVLSAQAGPAPRNLQQQSTTTQPAPHMANTEPLCELLLCSGMLALPMRCASPPACHSQCGGAAHRLAVRSETRRQTIRTCCIVRLLHRTSAMPAARQLPASRASSNPPAACIRVMPVAQLQPSGSSGGGGARQPQAGALGSTDHNSISLAIHDATARRGCTAASGPSGGAAAPRAADCARPGARSRL